MSVPPLTGILPVDKPLGWTSHDVVARVRRLAGQKAVGHAGTLDPLATGLLILVLGRATRLSSTLMESSKLYHAQVVLGVSTATDDAEAPLVTRTDISGLDLPAIERVVAIHRGPLRQVPPRYAAIKQGGRKLYTLARQGVEVETPPRAVTIYSLEIVAWLPPVLSLHIHCSPGTYIRSLARDIGAALGVGGYLHALRRVRSGTFSATTATPLTSLRDRRDVIAALLPPDRALLHLPALPLDAVSTALVCAGRRIPVDGDIRGTIRMYGPEGRFLALAEATQGEARPKLVMGSEW